MYLLRLTGLCLLLLVGGCGRGDYHDRMSQLHRLQQRNAADSVMDDRRQAEDLVAYFDSHGGPNERMLAHYLLGRTCYDTGDLPAALDAYHTAADCADTTAADCDHAVLSRVYTQTAEVFYDQLLPVSMLQAERRAVSHAMLAADTLQAAFCYSRLAEGYELQAAIDSALSMAGVAYDLYRRCGSGDYAASLGCSMANLWLQKGDVQRAAACLAEYEGQSGLFAPDGTVEAGREIYYYVKGLLCLQTGQTAEAHASFSRLLAVDDANCRMSACKGLQQLFVRSGQADSAVYYSLQGDSIANIVHRDIEMQKVLQLQAMYDYQRHERQAHQQTLAATRAQTRFLLALIAFLLLAGAATGGYVYYHRQLHRYILERRLRQAPVTQRLRQMAKANPPQQPALSDWKELRALIDREVPAFYPTLNRHGHELSDMDYDVCMLTRVHLSPSDIHKLKNCVPSYVSNIRKKLLLQLFNVKGTPDQFDERILEIS